MEPYDRTDEVYSVLCSHQTDDIGVKFVLANCGQQKGVQHRIRQWADGYICSRCSELINLACNAKINEDVVCYQCRGPQELEKFLISRQICSHDVPDSKKMSKVRLECVASEKPLTHELDLGGKKICAECEKKIIYKYQGQDECKICKHKVAELLANLSNSLANEETRMIKKMMLLLNQKKCPEEFKNELQAHCNKKKTQASEKRTKDHEKVCKLKDQKGFLQAFSQLNHKEGKYYFFSKCNAHKNISLKVCPTCIAVLLNINKCPYGCEIKTLQQNLKQVRGKQVYETGFIVFAPIPSNSTKQHTLQMILLRNIVIKNKLDQTEEEIIELHQAPGNQIQSGDYPQFGAVTQIDNNRYLLSGGLLVKGDKYKAITGNTWLFEILDKESELTFKAIKMANMVTHRTGHSSVLYHGEVFAIGGYNQKGYLSECEKFNISNNKWTALPPLKYQRSKPTAFVTTGQSPQIIVLGGVSPSVQVFIYGEKYSKDAKQWVTIKDSNPNYTDDATLTKIVSSTHHPALAKLDNVLLFGGSNYRDYSNVISNFSLKGDSFLIEPMESPTLISKKAGCEVGLLETADKNQKKLILFSGCLDHESAIDVEIVLVNIKDGKTISPVYTDKAGENCNDFSKLLNVDRHKFYTQLTGLLQERGIDTSKKLKNTKDGERKDRHTIETLWFWGRAVANYSVEKAK